jgi:hypothetical protein
VKPKVSLQLTSLRSKMMCSKISLPGTSVRQNGEDRAPLKRYEEH